MGWNRKINGSYKKVLEEINEKLESLRKSGYRELNLGRAQKKSKDCWKDALEDRQHRVKRQV